MLPDSHISDELNNKFGLHGWELVSVYKYEGDDNKSEWFERYIFKKKV